MTVSTIIPTATPSSAPTFVAGHSFDRADLNGKERYLIFGGMAQYTSSATASDISNSLWEYDPSTKLMKQLAGSTNLGSAAVLQSYPSPRKGHQSFVDEQGNLYIFGGFGSTPFGYTPYGVGYLNDLWKYDANSNSFSLISGNTYLNTTAPAGSSSQVIEPRAWAGSWFDRSSNRFFVFGGISGDTVYRK